MSTEVAARGLSKWYRLYDRPSHRLWELLLRRRMHTRFRALDDVSFALERGESLGIVGENGAGKSTLLKILAGITTPSEGSFEVDGTVAAILELGSGFHPEFSGRQNAILNAAMLGLGEEEIEVKLPEIVAFSELGDFIDRPVKSYSTGMTMRLAFSIATQVEPQVLIIDEALSVGDGYFQKKCMDALVRFIDGGGTLLFCSHAMYYVTSLCQQALWLRNGKVEAFGPALEVVSSYESFLLSKGDTGESEAEPEAEARPGGPARIESVRIRSGDRHREPGSREPLVLSTGDPLAIDLTWRTTDSTLGFHVGVGINRSDNVEICSFSTERSGHEPFDGDEDRSVTLEIPAVPFIKGELTIYVFLLDEEGLHIFDQAILGGALAVDSDRYQFGIVEVEHRWRRLGKPATVPLGGSG